MGFLMKMRNWTAVAWIVTSSLHPYACTSMMTSLNFDLRSRLFSYTTVNADIVTQWNIFILICSCYYGVSL